MLGKSWPWLLPLAQRYVQAIEGRLRFRHRDVIRFLLGDTEFKNACSEHVGGLTVKHWLTGPQQMQPVPAARNWDLPVIESAGALADWLWLEYGELDWFADLKHLGYKDDCSRLRHYHYRILAKPFGCIRLIEAPKRRLKKLQREILSGILERVPAHPAAHGFVKGRSIKTFVAPHAGQRVILRMDLRNFFVSLPAARIQAFFRTLGYPELVADLLGGICSNAVPRDVWNGCGLEVDPFELQHARDLYSRPHLPQGAPTSPALANLCAYRVDCRLAGLAKSAGAQYTRYADDLAFSGNEEFEKRSQRFSTHVAAILLEEGLAIHHRKTRIMRRGVRQYLAGLVANQGTNIVRADFDRLKAVLTNCVRLGPENQNRHGHPCFRFAPGRSRGIRGVDQPGQGKTPANSARADPVAVVEVPGL